MKRKPPTGSSRSPTTDPKLAELLKAFVDAYGRVDEPSQTFWYEQVAQLCERFVAAHGGNMPPSARRKSVGRPPLVNAPNRLHQVINMIRPAVGGLPLPPLGADRALVDRVAQEIKGRKNRGVSVICRKLVETKGSPWLLKGTPTVAALERAAEKLRQTFYRLQRQHDRQMEGLQRAVEAAMAQGDKT